MRLIIIICAAALAISGCTKVQRYDGPEVTRIAVFKSSRKLYLYSGEDVLKAYDIDLGFAPVGDKQVKGDGKTPEGSYIIDRQNPESEFYLSLGISYPNEADVLEARKAGQDPGGDIFIHGRVGFFGRRPGPDWTWGCISVTNDEIREIYSMVRLETPIDIVP